MTGWLSPLHRDPVPDLLSAGDPALTYDELDPRPTFLATRAITIQGTPAEIWPWLIQMG